MPDLPSPAFRYRTCALLGQWRGTAEAALADAIRAGQVRREADGAGWQWAVPGTIEQRADAPFAQPRNDNLPLPLARRSA